MHAPRGFTLIEVLVSLFVIGIVTVLSGALLSAAPVSHHARYENLALTITKNKIESLRGRGYAMLPASGSFSDPALSALPSGTGTLAVSAFNPDTKQATVTVTWGEPGTTASSSVSLTTLITANGGLK
jgi:prepilin-type N-terminal cleavage/methylation domain-containing protein